ncbi:MAG: signal transduction histidine kinase [Caulobacter sp.]|nr:signal transduction histidine kinase [Caulobacter sp.]
MSVDPIFFPAAPKPISKAVADTRLLEADHRIANSLTLVIGLIRLQAREIARRETLSGAEAGRLLEETAVRIDAVSRWHRLLAQYSDRDQVEVSDYLREVCQAAVASLALPQQIDLRTELQGGCVLAPDQVAPIALLTSEALTNAIKYAHPAGVRGRATVACGRQEDGRLRLTIADDGVGLPDGFDPAVDGGLGFRVMRSLARQVRGELTFTSTPLGLRVILTVPGAVNDHD